MQILYSVDVSPTHAELGCSRGPEYCGLWDAVASEPAGGQTACGCPEGVGISDDPYGLSIELSIEDQEVLYGQHVLPSDG